MTPGLEELTVADLAAAGRALPPAFTLRLRLLPAQVPGPDDRPEPGIAQLECLEMLRLLPGRRLVARVVVGDTRAVLKLFLGRGARRYYLRERAGCMQIAQAGIATPHLLAEVCGPDAGDAAYGLLFELIEPARGLTPADDADLFEGAAALARLHGAGCRHRDLHLDNFLRAGDRVYMIDGDGVRCTRRPPSRAACLTDLAVLCAQRVPLADGAVPQAYRVYARTRGWSDAPATELASRVRIQRHHRVRRYLQKAQRDCGEFLCRRDWRRYLVVVRSAWNEELAAFVANPERALAAAEVLKAGNSATVARLRLGGRPWVVKRYNHKNRWQALRRNLRLVARFRLAWCNGQRLHLLGIPTARPLLLLERRFGPLRGIAYLLMEDLGDRDLATATRDDTVDDRTVAAVVGVLRGLNAAGLVHGDTKASNFLLAHGAAAVVDLDAMHPGSDPSTDVARFLDNFPHGSAVRARFLQALGEAGLV
jgi:tRNA A-37 threonylcarbamoyl transferase component Bud32